VPLLLGEQLQYTKQQQAFLYIRKRKMIDNSKIPDKAMMLWSKDATFQFYNCLKLCCLYAEHSQLTSSLWNISLTSKNTWKSITSETLLVCSVEFKLLKWDWDIQLSGNSCNSREDRSHSTGLTSSFPVFANDQPLKRMMLHTSALYGIISKKPQS